MSLHETENRNWSSLHLYKGCFFFSQIILSTHDREKLKYICLCSNAFTCTSASCDITFCHTYQQEVTWHEAKKGNFGGSYLSEYIFWTIRVSTDISYDHTIILSQHNNTPKMHGTYPLIVMLVIRPRLCTWLSGLL